MKIRYAVTFEFLNNPPLTHRGTIAAAKIRTIAARAIEEAQTALQAQNWSSMVFVALERLDATDEPDTTDEVDEISADA